jgi:prolipoprotein diacylglyceryltransferase
MGTPLALSGFGETAILPLEGLSSWTAWNEFRETRLTMQQVLFHIPLHLLNGAWPDIPIFGYGAMLFVAFVACILLAGWLCQREGILPAQRVQDLAVWLFVCGIIGARITFMIQYRMYEGQTPLQLLGLFFTIWEGGLVFYGAALGGVVGYCLAYHFMLRQYCVSNWKMADVIAPCAALGLALGRVGCLLNGCCYGNVACADCPERAIHFPLSAPPRYHLVFKKYQTAAGFTMKSNAGEAEVDYVEPGSDAERKGLKPGDVIRKIDNRKVERNQDLAFLNNPETDGWPRGKNDLILTVTRRQGGNAAAPAVEVTLPAFKPWTIGLHPTQVYETISMVLLLVVMMAYWPFRRRDGELMVIFMLAYAVHRFLNEMLRDDTAPLFDGLTLSENGSILVFLAGLVLLAWLWRRPPQYRLISDPTPAANQGIPQQAVAP